MCSHWKVRVNFCGEFNSVGERARKERPFGEFNREHSRYPFLIDVGLNLAFKS